MAVIIAQLSGVGVFVALTLALGAQLRVRPGAGLAEATSRISHLAFWLGLVAPWTVGFFFPGPAALDRIAGLQALPLPPWARLVLGAAMLVGGVGVMQVSIAGLGRRGRGAPAFKLTQHVVGTGLYGVVRNPMSLGFYVACVGGAVLSGSTYALLYTALGVIPAHMLNLWFFEERELALRYGESYEQYRESTPFLVPRLTPRRRESE